MHVQPKSSAKHDILDRVDAVVAHCNVSREDVHEFYYQQGNTRCPSHVLCSDEASKSLVIAVRGTMSAADALSDMQAEGKPLEYDGGCADAPR